MQAKENCDFPAFCQRRKSHGGVIMKNMKKLIIAVLSCILPITVCMTANAEEIPEGYSFGVTIVDVYIPEPETTETFEPTPACEPATYFIPEVPEANENPESQTDKFSFDYTLETFAEIFTRETNKIRAEHGLPTFETDSLLSEMAQARMDESERMDHKRPDGSDPTTIFPEYGSELRCTGENMGSAGPSPKNSARGFETSPGHRKNLLNPDAKYMGVGVKWVNTIVGRRIAVLQLFATDE